MYICRYIPAFVVIVEIYCPLILVTTLLLVVKHSTTLSVVTGLELKLVWVSLTIVTQLFGCVITEMFCWLYSILGDFIPGVVDDVWYKQSIVIVEDEDGKTVGVTSAMIKYTYFIPNHLATYVCCYVCMYTYMGWLSFSVLRYALSSCR